ncbi:MAG: hypothetical protein EPO24_03245 [Bacteroidetes bacterium]|nr:MAG: hypothetical protein EPO24_03245 [Bacteroidota bacterium]
MTSDVIVAVTIGGKSPKLFFRKASLKQNLCEPTSITVEFSFNEHECEDVFNTASSSWLGESLVVGFSDRVETDVKKQYQGTVTSLSLSPTSLRVQALSEDHILGMGRNHKSFVDMKAHDIVTEIVQGCGMNGPLLDAPSSSLKFKFFHQYDESNRNVLKRLARYDGCTFYHNGEKFVYTNKLGGKESVSVGLEHLKDVYITCALENTKWRGVPYDFVKHTEPGENIVESGKATLPSHPSASKVYNSSSKTYGEVIEQVYNEPVVVKKDFEQFIKNQQALRAGAHVRLSGVTSHPSVAIGTAITCAEHALLKKPFVVTSLSAEFDSNVYQASFEAVADGATLVPREIDERHYMGLLQPAVVVDNKDKEKLGRVQIQYLWDTDGSAFAWARIAHAGAGKTDGGKSYGTHYIPRVKDHVLVACENGDPSLPIILGAIYHSEHKPDFVTENGTEEVLIARTPQESTIRVLDKQGSEEIVVSMRDNKNLIRLELKQPKITVESVDGTIVVHSKIIQITADEKIEMSAKDIDITASKNLKESIGENQTSKVGKDLKLTVGGKMEESVSMDINVKAGKNLKEEAGMNADFSAGTALSIKSTKVESSAAAVNIVKGALVQIN